MPKNILSAIEILRARNLRFAPPPLLHKVMVARKNLYFDRSFGERRRYSEFISNIQLM